MKNYVLFLVSLLVSVQLLLAQDIKEMEKKGFKKENLFTGGSISFSFFNKQFLVGGNPVFGYNLTNWADLGIVANYTYTSVGDYSYYRSNDKVRQSIYGGGVFTRLFPVNFLFVQAQIERNWIKGKYISSAGVTTPFNTVSANSFLIGAGYTTGRDPLFKRAYAYLAVLFDVMKNANSPYVNYTYDSYGNITGTRPIPIIRAGFTVPLFQGRRSREW